MNFKERFDSLCREKGETPTSIGTQLGFSRGTVSKWRSGKFVPGEKSLNRLAEFFGVSIDYLLGKSEIRCAEAEFDNSQRAKLILFGTEEVPEKAWWEVEQFVLKTKNKYHIGK